LDNTYISASGISSLNFSVPAVVPPFPACDSQAEVYGEYVTAAESILVALLLVWVSVYGYRRLISFLDWSRGSND